ncbi:MAG: hypothetical protein AAF266_14755 [Planctomycetota bacterium]
MFRQTLAAAALTAVTVPAAANPLGQLFNYTGQIRAQAQLVQAQADAAFQGCPSSRLLTDDIYDELEDLCRDLDRLEQQIAEPLTTRRQLRRIERLAHRLEEQACEVDEEIREALARARRRSSIGHVAALPHRSFGYSPHEFRHAVGHRGMHLVIGGGRFNINLGSARPHFVGRPLGVNFGGSAAGVPEPLAAALCAESDRLRLMTQQLAAFVCH